MTEDFQYTSQLGTYTPQEHASIHLTIHGDGDDKIELFYDRDGKRWDCKVTGDQTASMKTFVDWILKALPVCECQRKK